MSPVIERIENAGPDRRARRLIFSDHTSRLTSAVVVKALVLEEGAPVEPTELERDLTDAEETACRERALRLIGYRERSQSELRKRLEQDGYPPSIVEPLVERFVELAFVDDVRFSESFARSAAARGLGANRIRRELEDKGVARETASAAVAGVLSEGDDAVERARAVIRHAQPANRKERDRLMRRLISKGYDFATARAALDADEDE